MQVLDYNPLTGERVLLNYDRHTEQLVMTHEQDVSRIRDKAREMAADTNRTRKGIKNDLWHYACVPNIAILDMRQRHGVDFFDRNHAKRVFELLNTEYKEYKTTDKTHNVR